jgi:hypothetical protein
MRRQAIFELPSYRLIHGPEVPLTLQRSWLKRIQTEGSPFSAIEIWSDDPEEPRRLKLLSAEEIADEALRQKERTAEIARNEAFAKAITARRSAEAAAAEAELASRALRDIEPVSDAIAAPLEGLVGASAVKPRRK